MKQGWRDTQLKTLSLYGAAQGRWSASGTLSRLAAAVGLAPDVKFQCAKAQLYFTF